MRIQTRRSILFIFLLMSLTPLTAHAMARKPRTFSITLKVDFGSAGRPLYSGALEVEKGTTPKEAVSQVFSVLSGKSCCSLREVIAIDGVAIDPAKNRWWICKVNGSLKKVAPHKRKLKPGDKVEWEYIQNPQ